MLIPFGLKQGKFYDVSEVERGRSCGCICPSCKQTLVARKGDPEKKVHHFAHDKKAKEDQEEKIKCDYSFCVVARLVIKQCIRELSSFDMLFPEWKIELHKNDQFGRTQTVTGYATKSHTLLIEQFEVEPSAPYNDLDVLCYIGGYPVGIHFSYNGRPCYIPKEDEQLSLIDIDLEPLRALYATFTQKSHESFKELVMDYVFKVGSRNWLTHIRYASRKKELKAKLKELVEASNALPPPGSVLSLVKTRNKAYKAQRKTANSTREPRAICSPDGLCILCHKGRAGYIEDLICAPCLQNYYARGIYHVGDIKKAVVSECSD
ncbi:hypothetical protein EGH82_20790 [Vibrio ponticus]|uniref:Competence protein CoiA-like N-terminal domain-containing protein n=1 Tax=Vibrio ponticus TaxID=265668 RepID=A0A3N3DTY6_9VIBR|nr:hypothetical protein [Vibrio ponticus]ROV57935.1 hypothetical protein EGH82_20790 [Vibrio ponticus]